LPIAFWKDKIGLQPMTTVMDKSLSPPLSPMLHSKKASAKAALLDLHEPAKSVLSECFRQFGIEAVPMTGNAAERLKREKFEACVVKLTDDVQPVLESVRSSLSNSRMVIYGVGGSAQDAMRFSKYGINAVFNEPLERSATLKLVRATQTLVLHEFRRYVRIPVITEIAIVRNNGGKLKGMSHEISSGGMSIHSAEELTSGESVEVSFALLTLPRIWVRGAVTWRKPASKSFGVRFDVQDDRRTKIKNWINAYLEV
jgi:hypothetical protein